MPETVATTSGPQGGYEQVQYASGQQHVYETQPQPDGTVKKIHVKTDDMIRGFGHEPGPVPEEPTQTPEQPPTNPEVDALRGEMLEMMRQMEANNERRHQELMTVLQALVEQNRGGAPRGDGELPPGAVVGPPEDEGMGRMREHFANLDGDEDEEELPPPPPPPPPAEQLPPELNERLATASAELQAARDDLVRITIRRRARAGDGLTDARRQDAEDYRSAMDTYRHSLGEYMRLRREALQSEGVADNELRRQLANEIYQEQRRFADREVTMNEEQFQAIQEQGGFRAWRTRMVRRWANLGTGRKLLIGVGVGVAAAIASGPLGLGLAGLAAGSAVKFSLGLLNRSASARNVTPRSHQREVNAIETGRTISALHLRGAADSDEYLGGLVGANEGYLNERVRRAQRRNRIGNAIMLASTAAMLYGGLELGGVAPRAPHLSELWGGGPHHDVAPVPGAHESYTPLDLHGIDPNTIHAETPLQFQRGVLHLLHEQGIKAHGVTPEKLHHLNEWMATHNIASGMRFGPHNLEQNLVHFPGQGHEFVNANASAAQGFKIGADGTGRAGLDQWIRQAERVGIRFERTK